MAGHQRLGCVDECGLDVQTGATGTVLGCPSGAFRKFPSVPVVFSFCTALLLICQHDVGSEQKLQWPQEDGKLEQIAQTSRDRVWGAFHHGLCRNSGRGSPCLYWGDDLIPGRCNDVAVLWIIFFGLHVDLICMNREVLF